jgi:dTMP kinase
MSDAGHFISFEGIDRSGKSTQAAILAEALGDFALLVREPGGTELSERVRELLKNASLPITARAEALLFAAARADLVEAVIRPALADGRTVIADRFIDSSLAYQGAARGLGLQPIEQLNRWAADELQPGLTLLIEIDPDLARARGAEENDRFEDEGTSLQRAVAKAYDQLANDHPERIVRIDGDGSPDEVAARVRNTVADRLGIPKA